MATLPSQEEIPLIEASDTEAIRAAKDREIRVRGTVESTGVSRGSGMNFLNFADRSFTVVVYGRSLKNFSAGEPRELYDGKRVQVRGVVSFYNDAPQIVIERPDQISLLDRDPAREPAQEPAPEPSDPDPAPAPAPEPPAQAADPGKVDPRLYFDDP